VTTKGSKTEQNWMQ